MYYYLLSLRTTSFLMVNSSWTKNHVDSILQHSDILLVEFTYHLYSSSSSSPFETHPKPPKFILLTILVIWSSFSLTNQKRIILSVAQFRSVLRQHLNLFPGFNVGCFSARKRIMLCNYVYFIDCWINIRNIRGTVIIVGGSRNECDTQRVDGAWWAPQAGKRTIYPGSLNQVAISRWQIWLHYFLAVPGGIRCECFLPFGPWMVVQSKYRLEHNGWRTLWDQYIVELMVWMGSLYHKFLLKTIIVCRRYSRCTCIWWSPKRYNCTI